jgi:putative glutamine amidotransferase
MGKRVRIGVSAPAKGGYGSWLFTRIILAFYGAKAVKITTTRDVHIFTCKGFVIAGGADIDPRLYGEQLEIEWKEERKNRFWLKSYLMLPLVFLVRFFSSSTDSTQVDEARDKLELSIIEFALKNKLPILGICRGMQLMNIYKGGTLHKDIKAFYIETPHINTLLPKKTIHIQKNSLLFQILRHDRYRVNSLHHQSIDKLGDGLRSVAMEKNGVIQAIEDSVHPFYIGIQWHPEYLLQFAPQRALFFQLIKYAKE